MDDDLRRLIRERYPFPIAHAHVYPRPGPGELCAGLRAGLAGADAGHQGGDHTPVGGKTAGISTCPWRSSWTPKPPT